LTRKRERGKKCPVITKKLRILRQGRESIGILLIREFHDFSDGEDFDYGKYLGVGLVCKIAD